MISRQGESNGFMVAHRFLPNSEDSTTKIMLDKLGINSVEELFSDVPPEIRLCRELAIPLGLSEVELERLLISKLSINKSAPEYSNFIGGGNWLSHVPSVVSEIVSRGEFYTSYTPYQPEISQGMLQSMFEYQSQICELTEMEVANSSIYDWGTALGEAGRMASRVTRRKKILVSRSVSPERIGVLKTYVGPESIDVGYLDFTRASGVTQTESSGELIDSETAAVYIENPNFFGVIEEEAPRISDQAHEKGALFIVGVNPATLGVLKPPGKYGADIVVGDGQPLGLFPNFGGPLMGIFATLKDPSLLRQMPGRLIGLTTSKEDGRRGYTMILQTREQHIRREHATSNICTNEALFALAVNVYLAIMGPIGMEELGKQILLKSHHVCKRLIEEGLTAPHFSGAFFGDFTLKTKLDSFELTKYLLKSNILGGLPLGRFFEDLRNVSLFSFSDVQMDQELENLVDAIKKAEKT